MSARISLSQKSRPYKVEVYGLQDDYIGTLQSFNDSFIGQIIDPEITISDDGTQTFICSIPKFYIDPATNLKVENPRWADINNGVLAENTRILKVFFEDGRIYPFIIDKITDKRDSHFAIYKEIECNGMAYSELGKTGYKLELTSDIVNLELEENHELVPTINYWLDKVFPNEKDKNGKVIKWLTPWCYEVRMDWSHYSAAGRESTKVYEDSYVSSWGIESLQDEDGNTTSEKLVSRGFEIGQEKARFLECKGSNRYNITQSIAETFEVFCQYEYKCNTRGRFIKTYTDEKGLLWTGRKVIFSNRAIKADNPAVIEYKKNLGTINRIKESSEVYTKLYVSPLESSTMATGYISIADTPLNSTLDDFILNFDYLYKTNSISQYQMNFVRSYEVETHKLNQELINLAPSIETLTVDINNLKAKKTLAENEVTSAEATLQEYQTLRDSEVRNTEIIKNKDTAHTVIFVTDKDVRKAALHLQGINKDTIRAYPTSACNDDELLFTGNQLIVVEKQTSPTVTDKNFYLLVNDYGWPTHVYTGVDNDKLNTNNNIVYMTLGYCPKNEYEDICKQLEWRINSKREAVTMLENSISEKQKQLTSYEKTQQSILDKKEALNYKLEQTLGPALREGYWTPDSYEDPGEAVTVEKVPTTGKTGAVLIFDEESFEGEPQNYYYNGVQDQVQGIKTYYSYIDLSSVYANWEDKKLNNLTLHLQNPFGEYKLTTNLSGNQFLYYDGVKYYFSINATEGQTLKLTISANSLPQISINGGSLQEGTTKEKPNAINITSYFEGQGMYLGERLIYNNAGFIFGFLKTAAEIKPILLLNNINIRYNQYEKIVYSFALQDRGILKGEGINYVHQGSVSAGKFCYPRIAIYQNNVNYKSDKLKIIPYKAQFTEETQALKNYEDYSILLRGGRPFITLKLTNTNNFSNILGKNFFYRVEYRVSRANEMLYLDAKNVARDNSQPKYSYELKLSNLPNDINSYELGQLVYINDYAVGIHSASGYVSQIKMKLNSPQDDELEIKNYKTKFENLFSTITASSEAMRRNQHVYDIAAGGFNSDGTISGSVLQNSILNNNISMNYSNTNVEIDDVNGIVLTNEQPYLNGVFGQVKLTGGGIFMSDSVDASGARIWNTGITPRGINAAMISSGQLDVNKIRIFSGDNIAFQWNDEGIFAYKKLENGVDLNTFVRYSDRGLQFISGGETAVDLGWNGLLISTQGGATELSGDLGLVVYHGKKNDGGDNYAIRVGKFAEDNEYGMRLYKQVVTDDEFSYVPTLVTANNGELWLKDTLTVGDAAPITWTSEDGKTHNGECVAGISGIKDTYIGDDGQEHIANNSVRFWAGRDISMMQVAPFRVLQDGTLFASQANITGVIHATSGEFSGTIKAGEGTIGGWEIKEDMLLSQDGQTKLFSKTTGSESRILIGKTNEQDETYFEVTADGKLTANGATLKGTIEATGGTIGNLTIESLENTVGNIAGGMKNITVELTSSEGTVGKTDTTFSTDLIATVKRGGITISEEENKKCRYFWYYQDPGKEWTLINEGGTLGANMVRDYSFELKDKRYFKCRVEMEVEDSGN